MKVLWVSASAIGPASRILDVEYKGSSGVWIQNIYEELKNLDNCELSYLCFSKALGKNEIVSKKAEEGVAYCLKMPQVSFGRPAPGYLKKNVEQVIEKIKPDIIHIWGTETCVQNVVADCAPDIPKVVFLQGIIGIHSRYYGGYLKDKEYRLKYSLKQWIRQRMKSANFKKQVFYEAKEIKQCGNVIIDNEFSAAYCMSIDRNIKAYHYKMVPGRAFYEQKWQYDPDNPHTVFSVYGPNSDKGLHQLILALRTVKRVFPDVRLIIPGPFNITEEGKLKAENYLTSYEKLLSKMISDFDLSQNVAFSGKLSQEQMAQKMTEATIFVNPSIMEVHAGSLREAMACGMPCISSFCGSVCEFIKDGTNGFLYRYEEYEILAEKIILAFEKRENLSVIGDNARKTMKEMREINCKIADVYSSIIDKSK